MFERVLVVDVETSGLDPARDEILQLGAVLWEEGRAAARLETACRPSRPVPLSIRRLTGLAPEELASAPPLAECLERLDELRAPVVCAHNASFDIAFLAEAGWRPAKEATVLDTLELTRLLWPTGSHRLKELVSRLGGEGWEAHRAGGDADAAAWLLSAAVLRAASADPALRDLWRRLLLPVDPTVVAFLEEAPLLAGRLPDDGALARAALWARAGDRGAEALRRARELMGEEPRPEVDGWSRAEVAAAFARDGALSRRLPAFEWRPSQAEMAGEVAAALERDEVALVEAGTGTGKSLAYLVPAMRWALSQGERVVVSTHTLALQEQLLQKDVPAAIAAIGSPVRVALLKGQTQYLCRRRWRETLEREMALGPAERRFLARVASWLFVTGEGDRAELSLPEADEAHWPGLVIEAHACTGRRCPEYSECYLMAARRRAAEAALVIVNHALLLSDLRAEGHVLPEHSRLIVDEAHHLEDLAADHLGDTFDRAGWLRRLAEVYRPRDRAGGTLLARLAQALARAGEDGLLAEGAVVCRDAADRLDEFFDAVEAWLSRPAGRGRAQGGAGGGGDRERMLPAAGDGPEDPAWLRVEDAAGELAATFEEVARLLQRSADTLSEEDRSGGAPETDAMSALAEEAARTAAAFADGARTVSRIVGGREGWVSWCRWERGHMELRAAPIDVGPILREELFEKRDTVVLTSATLSVAGSLGHLAGRLGLEGLRDRTRTARVASPFSYREQALLAIPRGLPPIPTTETAEYWDAVAPFLEDLLLRTGGRALLLFTSHRALRQAHARLRGRLEEADIQALAQSLDGSRTRILEALRADPRTAVFGAASFWEGVDVPGENLQLVVLMRLPFRRPNHPLEAARAEAAARAGRDAFRERSLPEAVLRFKQGFGRLIRTREDRGAVVCLDDRMVRTSYGQAFLASLPGASIVRGTPDEVSRAVGDWLSGARSAADFDALEPDELAL